MPRGTDGQFLVDRVSSHPECGDSVSRFCCSPPPSEVQVGELMGASGHGVSPLLGCSAVQATRQPWQWRPSPYIINALASSAAPFLPQFLRCRHVDRLLLKVWQQRQQKTYDSLDYVGQCRLTA